MSIELYLHQRHPLDLAVYLTIPPEALVQVVDILQQLEEHEFLYARPYLKTRPPKISCTRARDTYRLAMVYAPLVVGDAVAEPLIESIGDALIDAVDDPAYERCDALYTDDLWACLRDAAAAHTLLKPSHPWCYLLALSQAGFVPLARKIDRVLLNYVGETSDATFGNIDLLSQRNRLERAVCHWHLVRRIFEGVIDYAKTRATVQSGGYAWSPKRCRRAYNDEWWYFKQRITPLKYSEPRAANAYHAAMGKQIARLDAQIAQLTTRIQDESF